MLASHLGTYRVDSNTIRHMFLRSQRLQFISFHISSFFYSLSQFIYQLSEVSSEQTMANYHKIPLVH